MDDVSLIENFDKELDEDLLKALMIGIVQLEEFKGKEHVDVISDARRKFQRKYYKIRALFLQCNRCKII